jgi:O-antigen ligase
MKKSMASGRWHLENTLYYFLILFLPTQLGRHHWPDFSYILGIRVDYLSPTIYFTDIMVGLLFMLWMINKNSKSEYRNPKQSQNTKNKKPQRFERLRFKHLNLFRASNFVLLIFVFYLLVNIYLSGRIVGGLYSLLKILEMAFVAYYTAKFIISRSVLQKVITVLGIGVVAESVLAIVQYFNQGSIGSVLYYLGERTFNASTPGIANASLSGELVLRPYGTLPHPNVLAGYLLVGMTMVLFSLKSTYRHCEAMKWLRQSLSKKSLNKDCFATLAMTTALIIGTIALILSMSRVAIVLWVVVLAYFLSPHLIRHSGLSRVSLIKPLSDSGVALLPRMTKVAVLFLVVGVISILAFSPLSSRFTNIKITDESIVQRSVLIESSIVMIKSHPLFGVGLGNFLPTLAQMQKPLMVSTYLQPVHNIFLLVAAETGLIGLGFFTWFLWKTFRRIKNYESRSKELLYVLFFIILITGMGDHYWLTLQQGQLLFAFVIGLCYNPHYG